MSPYRTPARPEPVLTRERELPTWPLVMLVVALLLGIVGAYRKCTEPRPVPTCADFASTPRSQVPARCFSDFLQDGGP